MIGIIGAVCGDIIGSTYEFRPVKNIPYDFDLITSNIQPTDDTTCTMAVADWLLNTDRSHELLVEKLYKWCNKYPMGFGPMFLEWLRRGDGKPYGSFGNGSAMRVSVLVTNIFGSFKSAVSEQEKLASEAPCVSQKNVAN